MKRIWIDLLNPSHPLFFKPIINELKKDFEIQVTVRHRAETISLTKQLGLEARVLGAFYDEKKMKTIATVNRVITLFAQVKPFDWSISLEDSDCVAASRMRLKKSILLFDNDLKYKTHNGMIQLAENAVKLFANHIIIPKTVEHNFKRFASRKNFHVFDGYKEDVYLADYKPDPSVKGRIPFDRYVVIRPEALKSFYVHEKSSLVPALLSFFQDNDIPVVYLPREKEDENLATGFDVFIPNVPMNGLDLCYYSDAVLTGSGTMAREAACMGKPAVSFFPNNDLLSVDEQLIKDGKMIHSRDAMEIGNYVLSQRDRKISTDFRRSIKVKREILAIIKDILS
jgi:predicted glycosyltransferase